MRLVSPFLDEEIGAQNTYYFLVLLIVGLLELTNIHVYYQINKRAKIQAHKEFTLCLLGDIVN